MGNSAAQIAVPGARSEISGGRSGWNVVTSANEAEASNFGREHHLPKHERYKRAREFVGVVRGLWSSWDEDAFLFDKADGRFYDPAKRHRLDHAGEYFKVRGPLTVSRSPQGEPVIVQAGASQDGRQLAAETAEVVFCAHQSLDAARAFYADVKGRMPAAGRDPDHLKIMPGLGVMVAPSRQHAIDNYEALQDLIHPHVGVALLSKYISSLASGQFSNRFNWMSREGVSEVCGGCERACRMGVLSNAVTERICSKV